MTTKANLLNQYPSKIKGIPISVILDLADEEDYELLADKEMFIAFCGALVASRTIAPPYKSLTGEWCWHESNP